MNQPPKTPQAEPSLRRELLAVLVLYLALAVLPILFGLMFCESPFKDG